MKAADRKRRDAQVVQLFLDGLSYREIGAAAGLRSPQSVGNIVQRELKASAARRGLLVDECFAVWQERTEQLFHAHWDRALEGDHRSAELCCKLLAQQARVYGLEAQVGFLPTAAQAVEGEQGPLDELARLRAARAGA